MGNINIKIEAPKQGIAQSEHIGFPDMRNLDISSIPGVVTLNNLLAKVSATTVTAQINWFVRHPITPAECYALDNGGNVYRSGDSGSTWALMTGFTAGGHGNGLAIWKNYLIVARDAYLDVCGDGATSGNGTTTGISNAGWTNSWKAIDSDILWHPMLVSKNDSKLYGGAGRFVFSLDENTGQTFVPATAGTFTWTQQALDLPTSYRIKCVEELGNNLMCGTWQGTAVTDIRIADIFPWDRSSVSFGQPIVIADYGVHAMLNVGNILVVLAGTSGTIFRCDSANAYVIGQIAVDLSGGKYLEWYPGSICNYKNKTFFGVGNGGTTVIPEMGIYSLYQTGKGNILNLEHTISTGNDGTSKPLKVSALLPITRDTILVGWRDDTTYGIDLTTATSYSTGYSAYFTSPLYTVGTNKDLHKFTEAEISFSRVLRTNEGVKIAYRKDTSASFTDIGTYDYTTYAGILSKNIVTELPSDIKECEQIQFRIYVTGTTTTPEVKFLTFK